jgi:hypothetical protein
MKLHRKRLDSVVEWKQRQAKAQSGQAHPEDKKKPVTIGHRLIK